MRTNATPAKSLLLTEAKRALPYALVLAVCLGLVVVVGANLSNAFPSEKRPFGWDGPAHFESAVAMVRTDLVLAASVPGLLLGARALAHREPGRDRAGTLAVVYLVHAAMLGAAAFVAGGIGAWGSFKTPFEAYYAFSVAHGLLAISFYSLAFLWACHLREHALAAAAATWLVFLGMYEGVTRTILFRTEGYHNLAAGQFPDWFWASQAFSPLSSYRGTLILWREDFRDYMEKATLTGAELPGFLVPATFIALTLVLWVALPLLLGLAGWSVRSRVAKPQARRVPTP